jgi:hypothetical protein
MRRQLSGSIAAVCALFLGAEARADLTYEVEAGVGHSDNITRVETEKVDETLATIGANVEWMERTRRLEADVLVDLDYVEYLDDTYDGEVLGTADANLVFGLVPERLLWQVQDSFGQAQSDPFAPVTPDNSENVNYFTTGPDLMLNLGSQNSMRLFGRYSTTNYEVTDLDGERTGGGLSLIRALSGASSVALNGSVEESEFDNPASSGYENRSVSVSYDFTGGRTTISSQLGYSWIELDDGTKNGGELIEINITREMSSASSLMFSLGSQFSDAGNSLRGLASAGTGGGPGQIVASSDPFENRTASLAWNFQRNRTGISLGVAYDESIYEEQTQYDRTRISYHGNYSRQLRPTLTFMLAARFSEDEFDLSGLKFDDTQASASLTWEMSRHLGLRASLDHFARGSSQPGGDYDENRAFLTITYSGGRTQ